MHLTLRKAFRDSSSRPWEQQRVWILADLPLAVAEATSDLMEGNAAPSWPDLCPLLSVCGQSLTVLTCQKKEGPSVYNEEAGFEPLLCGELWAPEWTLPPRDT